MNNVLQPDTNVPAVVSVAAGEDQFAEYRGIGIGSVAFKVFHPTPTLFLFAKLRFTKKGGLPDICTTVRRNGSTWSKESLSWR
jgi:hypothetical protein